MGDDNLCSRGVSSKGHSENETRSRASLCRGLDGRGDPSKSWRLGRAFKERLGLEEPGLSDSWGGAAESPGNEEPGPSLLL